MKVVSCGVHLTTKVPADIRGTVVISAYAHDSDRPALDSWRMKRTRSFPPPHVTSDLARTIQIARSWPKQAYCGKPHRRAFKSPVLKILTFKFFDIKILPRPFCKPRAQQDFPRVWGEGGTLH
jgi:hypothetical protein